MSAENAVMLVIIVALLLPLLVLGGVALVQVWCEHRRQIEAIRAEVSANLARIRAGEPHD